MTGLPVEAVLPELVAALADPGAAVLVAPPGAGKTTLVPLALLAAPWRGDGRILVLEPRRLAARAAAARMAELLGEETGGRVGYRIRLDSRVSARTRIEVVTGGVFTRMILDDPELGGVAAVLFDEFHERSIDADLGLALALDARAGLRPDLRLLAMSATIDGARVARLLGDAPVVASEGRLHPVETRHLPRQPGSRVEDDMAAAIRMALADDPGSLLAFLPGQAEIERTAERLAGRLPAGTDLFRLHGTMPPAEQDRAIRPAPAGRRKIVLATNVAETSLTIEDVRIVIDSGLARVPVYEPGTGLTRLETVRASRAAIDQRRGRAGRTGPGICWRLWAEPQTAALPAFGVPEMLAADLAPLVLALADWGVADPGRLAWLDPPPAPALAEARSLLVRLGAIDADGRPTGEGRALARLGLPPRLGHMLRVAARMGAAELAGRIAVILTEPGLGGPAVDLRERLARLAADRSPRGREAGRLARRFAAMADASTGRAPAGPEMAGPVLALAFPDRIAQARGAPGAFRLANGRGGVLDAAEPLAREPFLAVAELAGTAAHARIRLAAPLSRAEIEAAFADAIAVEEAVAFDPATGAVRALRRRMLGRLVLGEEAVAAVPDHLREAAMVEAVRRHGLAVLPWGKVSARLRRRVAFLRALEGEPWPDLGDAALAADPEGWLAPWLPGRPSLAALGDRGLAAALAALLPPGSAGRLEREAPTEWTAPSGRTVPVDYGDDATAAVALRVQELYGLDCHPAVAGGRVPLTLTLLSPADRPIQITRDLPGFWRGSWKEVRSAMRGRYPKHDWPEDPLSAEPGRRPRRG